jgi:hypothetical protein
MIDAESVDHELIDDSALTMTQEDENDSTKSKSGTVREKRLPTAGIKVAKEISSQVSSHAHQCTPAPHDGVLNPPHQLIQTYLRYCVTPSNYVLYPRMHR